MKPLTALDAAFLYLESERAPMHVGGIILAESTLADGSPYTFDHFRQMMSERLHLSPIFRRRIVELPLNLGHPYWIEDPAFSLDNHLLHVSLPDPGGWAELMELSARFFSSCLSRSRPLWDGIFVTNVKLDTFDAPVTAFLSKVHHCAVDGVSGAEILGALLDPSPEPRVFKDAPAWEGERIPSAAELLARSYGKAIGKTASLTKMLGQTVASSAKTAVGGELRNVKPPPMPFAAPKTLLNVPVDSHRTFSAKRFSLADIKRIKNMAGGTVNDVVLAVCAGALRRYLEGRNDLPDKPLIAMAPISTRTKEQSGTAGNQITGMLVSLATDLSDPLQRLDTIMGSARGSKTYSRAAKVTDILEFVPSATAAAASRLYCSMKVADRHRPFFNCIITNVPGPPVPLYLAGSRMLANIGMAPIFDGIGLILVIFSYNGQLTISATSCRGIIPDPEALTEAFAPAMAELEDALTQAGPQWRDSVTPVAPPKPGATDATRELHQSLDRVEALLAKLQQKAETTPEVGQKPDM